MAQTSKITLKRAAYRWRSIARGGISINQYGGISLRIFCRQRWRLGSRATSQRAAQRGEDNGRRKVASAKAGERW
jgi:hypothetical protein